MRKRRLINMRGNIQGVVEDYDKERKTPYYEPEAGSEKKKKYMPTIDTRLRHRSVIVPEVIYRCSGISIMGKRIKSILFTTDIAVIRNNNADAIFAVYPFTPEATIMSAITEAASVPVFTGIGGGTTSGKRSVMLGLQAELLGAYGVVVNAPMRNEDIHAISQVVDVPVIATVSSPLNDIQGKVDAGASIINVSGGKATADLVRKVRDLLGPEFPIMASGGHEEQNILNTIEAGANAITYTAPSSADIFKTVMVGYREGLENKEHEE